MVPALTARKLGMMPRIRFGCGGGVFCAAGFALSDCSPGACAPLGCVPWPSASAALSPQPPRLQHQRRQCLAPSTPSRHSSRQCRAGIL